MARPRQPKRIYRKGEYYWAYFSRNDRRSLGTKDEVQAWETFNEIVQSGGFREVSTTEKTIADLIKITYDRCSVSNAEKTAYELGNNLKRVGLWLESQNIIKPHQVSKEAVEGYKAFRLTGEDKVGPARVNRELSNWHALMRIAQEYGLIKSCKDLFSMLKEPKPDNNITVPPPDHINKFLDAIDSRYKPLMQVTVGSGIRASEARHFTKDNVKSTGENSYQLTITPLPAGSCRCHKGGWTTKNYRYRVIPISKSTYNACLEYLETRELYNLHKKTSERKVWGEMYLACEVAGIQPLSMHDLRHTYASYLYDAGFSIAQISKFLGHSSLQVTERYIHTLDKDLPTSDQLPL